ncbi:MAG: tetratricopeptide repeat protein [Woeseiaceae bacterium]|nr:tetratricopeptide repeat protein [Woeseiaceae bacterium]
MIQTTGGTDSATPEKAVMSFIDELKRRNVIRVAIAYAIVAWLIAQVTELAFDSFGTPDWVIKTVLFLLIIGLPLALFFAWAFELTPEGLKREKDVDRSESITHVTGRKLDYTIIAVLTLALGYFVVDKFLLGAARDVTEPQITTDKSIAVLPFVNMSSDAEQEYFSDGIAEELLNVLSKIPGLRVSARTSSFQFKGENLDVVKIGQQLNSSLVLEGSVRKSGANVRITAQLIDAGSGFQLWSETYDRQIEDVFQVQDEISAAIVSALREHLGLQVSTAPRVRAAENPAAHEAYLRGLYLMAQDTRAGYSAAAEEFRKALSHDPDYAIAHAGLAMVIAGEPNSQVRSRSALHVRRAMALDPSLAEAHVAEGLLLYRELNLEEALTSFRRAVQINPNYALAYSWMGQLLNLDLGRYDEAFPVRERAMRLDPLSIPTIVFYVQALVERNRLAEAERELAKIASIFPHVYAYRHGSLMSRGGKISLAVLGSLEALRINPAYGRVRNGLSFHFATTGLEEEALAISSRTSSFVLHYLGKPADAVALMKLRVAEDPESSSVRHDLGLALAGAGDYANARPILEEMWRLSGGRISKRGDLLTTATAAALIAARRAAGEEDRTDELVAAIMDNVRRYRQAGIVGDGRSFGPDYEEGIALYLSGDHERGLALLDKASEDGVFIPMNEAYLQAIYDDPGFAPIRARQEARQVRERQKILAVVCTDNPYEAVWQPAEGTCQRFAAPLVN